MISRKIKNFINIKKLFGFSLGSLILILVGLPGAGKTTTLAKIMGKFIEKRETMAIITLDYYNNRKYGQQNN